MASKDYISIIRLFNHCDIPVNGQFSLPRAKKQLQAELGVASDGFIQVEGHNYTRQYVFEELDHPRFTERLVYHGRIWESPQVLRLLEEKTTRLDGIDKEFSKFNSDPAFDSFFSPFFAGPFQYMARNMLGAGDITGIAQLLRFEEFLLPEEREEAFRPVRLYLDENIRLLKNVKADNYKIMLPKIHHWIDSDWSAFLNNLPHEFFEQRETLVRQLINLTVAIQAINTEHCRAISYQLDALTDLPESLSGLITSNHNVFTVSSNSSSSDSVNWRALLFVLWIIVMVLRWTSKCDSGSSHADVRYQYGRPVRSYELPPEYAVPHADDTTGVMRLPRRATYQR
ncbi:MAG: hypothetical protein ABWZ25_00020 [Chitinophagaceae bacterium]